MPQSGPNQLHQHFEWFQGLVLQTVPFVSMVVGMSKWCGQGANRVDILQELTEPATRSRLPSNTHTHCGSEDFRLRVKRSFYPAGNIPLLQSHFTQYPHFFRNTAPQASFCEPVNRGRVRPSENIMYSSYAVAAATCSAVFPVLAQLQLVFASAQEELRHSPSRRMTI